MSKENTVFAEVILPLPLKQMFSYEIPAAYADEVYSGMRVVVPFGKKKLYTGIIYTISNERPHFSTKEILSLLDDEPVIDVLHLKFWKWIADYYMCSIGEVYRAALPAGMKPEGESVLTLQEIEDITALSPKEQQIVNLLLNEKDLSLKKLQKKLDFKGFYTLNKLKEKNIISVKEKLRESYKIKTESYLKLSDDITAEGISPEIAEKLSRAKKQKMALEFFLKKVKKNEAISHEGSKYLKRNEFMSSSGVSASVLRELIKKGYLLEYEQEIDRLSSASGETEQPKAFSKAQEAAYGQIKTAFKEKDIVLLHGQTSSGKTEIYIKLIAETIKQGRQVLYLLPEIALSTQIIERLKKHFGELVGVYHSKYSDAERTEVWRHISPAGDTGKYQIILGVRSSIFLPFNNLGLIIADEEHESSYKQYQPTPRYHAANAAAVLAKMHKGKLLLGSATPSIESYHNALEGKYTLVELNERYGNIALPEIILANVKEARRIKKMKSVFTPELFQAVSQALANKEQIILFQNRRGFSPFLICNECSWVPRCEHCDVSMVYHRHSDQLVCHYCGYSYARPELCTACGQPSLKPAGFGTEKIQEETELLFPKAKTLRMDLDTTGRKASFQKIISDFENRRADILIGTQMVSKGLDFGNVSVVGIMQADLMLNYPDFRACERSFQMMVQVSGRAGRRGKRGKVIIQTNNPEHHVIQAVVRNDFDSMYQTETEERKLFNYPPYYRLIQITIRDKNLHLTDEAAAKAAFEFKRYFGKMVLGPEYPPVARVKNWYMKSILIKIEREQSVQKAKYIISQVINQMRMQSKFRYIQFVFDADPV
jgi:primosomal protein N' (replication factor Y)